MRVRWCRKGKAGAVSWGQASSSQRHLPIEPDTAVEGVGFLAFLSPFRFTAAAESGKADRGDGVEVDVAVAAMVAAGEKVGRS